MFVLLDIEWVESEPAVRNITQIAAMRVDENWNAVASFDALIRPVEPDNCSWEHMAYNGHSPEEFCASEFEHSCLERFMEWLTDDDILCCWHSDSYETLSQTFKRCSLSPLSLTKVRANGKIRGIASNRGITAYKMYDIAQTCGIEVPNPEHCSTNDVFVLQQILLHFKLNPEKLVKKVRNKPKLSNVQSKPQLSKRKKNEKWVSTCELNFLYAPKSSVFHRRDCKVILSANTINGCIHYKTAAKKRRPCKLCNPIPVLSSELFKFPSFKVKSIKGKLSPAISQEDRYTVGYCHSQAHPGKLNRSMFHKRKCLSKHCRKFEKYENAYYWIVYDERQKLTANLKARKKKYLSNESVQAAAIQELIELFQGYISDIGYSINIVRIEKLGASKFNIYYISDNDFDDSKLFPEFTNTIKFFFPDYRFIMRHLKAPDGNYVTINTPVEICKME
jgi:hypothetical protein